MELRLIRSAFFGNVNCDFWQNDFGEVFMTSKQLGSAIGYSDPQKGMDNLIDRNELLKTDEFSVTLKMRGTDGKEYDTRVFNEDGIYESTLLAKTQKAASFRHWVRNFLKALRKGDAKIIYSGNETTPSYMIDDPIKRAEHWIQERKEKMLLEGRVADLEPKARYVDLILQSKSTITTTQIAKDYGLSGKSLNDILQEEKVQYKQNKQWLLYRKYQDRGYTSSYTFEVEHNNGDVEVKMNTRWTQAGRLFIHDILTNRGIKPNIEKHYGKAK